MAYIGNTPAEAFSSFQKQDFSTSATTSYTLDHPVSNQNEIALFINFVRQEPTAAYTASGTTLTLTSATSSSDDMYCVYLGKAVQTVNPPSGSVGSSQVASTIITGQTAETSIATDDTVLIHDTSAGALRKMTRANFISGVGGTNTPAFMARRSNSQTSVPDVTETKVEFPTQVFDVGSCYDESTSKFTVPSGEGGKYFLFCGANAYFYSTTGWQLNIHLYKNGSKLTTFSAFDYVNSTQIVYGAQVQGQCMVELSASDYIEVYLYGNTYNNGAFSISGGDAFVTRFGGYKIIE